MRWRRSAAPPSTTTRSGFPGVGNQGTARPSRLLTSDHCCLDKLQLPPELAVKRIGAAAAQRDLKHDQAPEQWVLPSAPAPPEALRPVGHERDDGELNRDRRGEEPGEQAENDAD